MYSSCCCIRIRGLPLGSRSIGGVVAIGGTSWFGPLVETVDSAAYNASGATGIYPYDGLRKLIDSSTLANTNVQAQAHGFAFEDQYGNSHNRARRFRGFNLLSPVRQGSVCLIAVAAENAETEKSDTRVSFYTRLLHDACPSRTQATAWIFDRPTDCSTQTDAGDWIAGTNDSCNFCPTFKYKFR